MTLRRSHLLIVVAIVGAYALGRHTARAPDETTHLEVVEQVEAEERIEEETTSAVVEDAQEVRTEERIRIVYRDRWRSPEGEERETEIEVDAAALRELAEATRTEAKVETRTEVKVLDFTREMQLAREISSPRPDWRVGGLIGVDLGDPSLTYGAQIERRILGPVYVGAWGLSSGQAGLSVGVEF